MVEHTDGGAGTRGALLDHLVAPDFVKDPVLDPSDPEQVSVELSPKPQAR